MTRRGAGLLDEAGRNLDSVGVVSKEVGDDRDDAETGAQLEECPTTGAQVAEGLPGPAGVGEDEIGELAVRILGEVIEHRCAIADERLEHFVDRHPVPIQVLLGHPESPETAPAGCLAVSEMLLALVVVPAATTMPVTGPEYKTVRCQ